VGVCARERGEEQQQQQQRQLTTTGWRGRDNDGTDETETGKQKERECDVNTRVECGGTQKTAAATKPADRWLKKRFNQRENETPQKHHHTGTSP
jgi:hypothetical protein